LHKELQQHGGDYKVGH
jgi:hypothetical protein